MKQPNFRFFENVNGKATGSDVKAEVYNQGVKREGVEASGVEQSSCDARVWALPRDKTR